MKTFLLVFNTELLHLIDTHLRKKTVLELKGSQFFYIQVSYWFSWFSPQVF